ncbi:pyridoxal phosphate-dependent aminotransferase [Saprospiraceae bacterium]
MEKHLVASHMAENMSGSEIIKLAWEINARISEGQHIYNLTIGDFNPNIFPIPQYLTDKIKEAYNNHQTNYPPGEGIPALRDAISHYLKRESEMQYSTNEILVAGGSRPLIYAIYKTLLDPKDTVLYPVPSWNNNHYAHLTGCKAIEIETLPENNFLPVLDDIKKYLSKVNLLALCSPLNPTGTCFSKKTLNAICKAVIKENEKRRIKGKKALYIMYDSIYWGLASKKAEHFDPVSLHPELRDYTISIHGISKVLAGTGVRVGWAWGPEKIIRKMKALLGHIGAWAPKAEQVATAQFLDNHDEVKSYLAWINKEVSYRLETFYDGFQALNDKGYQVDALRPQGAIYLTVLFDLIGRKTKSGKTLETIADVSTFLIDEAKVALVPFSAFGSKTKEPWYRLSVGTCTKEDVGKILDSLEAALASLR